MVLVLAQPNKEKSKNMVNVKNIKKNIFFHNYNSTCMPIIYNCNILNIPQYHITINLSTDIGKN